ncbi:hypothetical protein BG000_007239 [Podila horticola]|nr:hypothetical protein BG000_007239 [Podila horticola]
MYGITDESEEVIASTFGDSSVVNDDNPSAPATQHWPIDYLLYARHFDTHNHHSKSVLVDLDYYNKLEPRLKSYVENYKLAETYASNAVNLTKNDRFITEDPITIQYLGLYLTVEFASHFQFRMLQGMLNINELYLSIYSIVHPVERV